jgi:hypothetical protein
MSVCSVSESPEQSRKLDAVAVGRPDGSPVPGASKTECLAKSPEKDPLNPSNARFEYMYGRYGLSWDGDVLRHGRRKVGSIERDAVSGMWRVRLPSGRLTDVVNLTRAKDLACSTALRFFDLRVPA